MKYLVTINYSVIISNEWRDLQEKSRTRDFRVINTNITYTRNDQIFNHTLRFRLNGRAPVLAVKLFLSVPFLSLTLLITRVIAIVVIPWHLSCALHWSLTHFCTSFFPNQFRPRYTYRSDSINIKRVYIYVYTGCSILIYKCSYLVPEVWVI